MTLRRRLRLLKAYGLMKDPRYESTARCTKCPAVFTGPTEVEAARKLSNHAIVRHDLPPYEDC